jgi:hypothetical protein
LLKLRGVKTPEGSNPSLSANYFCLLLNIF